MKFKVFALALILSLSYGKILEFSSSNLPIVIIDTDGKNIPDEPKITAGMKILWHEDGSRNYLTDTEYNYDGLIGIEMRGSSSQDLFPKKQYAVETRDESGENLNISLLGFPKENDWILHAPYSDKTLMRNVLTYTLTRKTGWYASRCKFCELVKNGEYMGIYILMEKIKRDDNRVDINKLKENEISGDDLTGGYVIKIDKFTGEHTDGWYSKTSDYNIFYQYHEPKDDEIVPEQKQYIQDKIEYFETAMADGNFSDWSNIIDISSFIDYMLITELTKNIDAYRLSTYLYKDKDSNNPKIFAGPVWDYNLAFGNANYFQGDKTDKWLTEILFSTSIMQGDDYFPPFWWKTLWESADFRDRVKTRWQELRKSIFSTDAIFGIVDSVANLLEESVPRNYDRWDYVLGYWVWPNPSGYQNRTTYLSEVNYLKSWIYNRLDWIDNNIDDYDVGISPGKQLLAGEYFTAENYPNPFNPGTHISFQLPRKSLAKITIFNLRGEFVKKLYEGPMEPGKQNVYFDASDQQSGVYFYQIDTGNRIFTGKAALIK